MDVSYLNRRVCCRFGFLWCFSESSSEWQPNQNAAMFSVRRDDDPYVRRLWPFPAIAQHTETGHRRAMMD